jgi:hypothetical protein
LSGSEGAESAAERTASTTISNASARRRRVSAAKAKAELEEDLEELVVKFNAYRFIVAVVAILLFDAVVFQSLDSWAGPVSLLAIELILIFVLARYYEIPEAVQFTYRLLEAATSKEKDPGAG